jgi:4-hydroxy-2-oxoheptanedioate aldolase
MRANGLKRKLAEGRRVCGVLADVSSEDIVELFGHLGFDFAILDGQHGGLNPDRARALCRAAELTGMTAIVRVPRNDASVILAYLDAGALGIVVPNIADGAQAAAAAEAMRYPPLGQRGASSRSSRLVMDFPTPNSNTAI